MQISFVLTDYIPYFITIGMLDKNNFIDHENLAELLLKILEVYHPQFCLFMAPTADLWPWPRTSLTLFLHISVLGLVIESYVVERISDPPVWVSDKKRRTANRCEAKPATAENLDRPE